MSGRYEIGDLSANHYFFGLAIVLGLLCGLVSTEDSLSALVQWQLQTLIPMALLLLSFKLLEIISAFRLLNPWVKLVMSGILGSVLFSPFALFLDVVFQNEVIQPGDLLSSWIEELCSIAIPICLAWVAVNALWILGYQITKRPPDSETPTEKDEHQTISPPLFFELIPEDAVGKLIYLKAELHYLKVVTDKGSSLILFNLKDAVDQLDTSSGIQSHRSYWVSKDSIRGFDKVGRQGLLSLNNGEQIPVSRSNVSTVLAEVNNLTLQ